MLGQVEIYLNLAHRLKDYGSNEFWIADITCVSFEERIVHLAVIGEFGCLLVGAGAFCGGVSLWLTIPKIMTGGQEVGEK